MTGDGFKDTDLGKILVLNHGIVERVGLERTLKTI